MEITTIQIYREDLSMLNKYCKKTENLRDLLHEVINKWYSKKNPKKAGEKALYPLQAKSQENSK